MESIASVYTQKKKELEEDIVVKLNEYIPIKLTKNILLTSPERQFTIQRYKNKMHMDEVLQKFDEVQNMSKSLSRNNISCNGISITGDGNITTQCTVYGDVSVSYTHLVDSLRVAQADKPASHHRHQPQKMISMYQHFSAIKCRRTKSYEKNNPLNIRGF